MFKKEFKVTYPDGRTHEVMTANPDVIRFERKFNIGIGALGSTDLHAEHLTYLAWAALRRTEPGGIHPDWDEFAQVADIELKVTREDIEEQLADVEAQRAAGDITATEHLQTKRALERQLAEITEAEAAGEHSTNGASRLGEAEAAPSPT